MNYVRYSNKDVNLCCVLCSYSCVLVHIGLMFLVLVKGDSDGHTCVCLMVNDSTYGQVYRCRCLLENVTLIPEC
jgi:hypothetical protein